MVQVVNSTASDWRDKKLQKTEDTLKGLAGTSKEQAAARLAAEVGLPYFDLHIFPASQEDVTLVSEENAKKHQIAVFEKSGGKIRVGFADPKNSAAADFVESLADDRGWQVEAYVVSVPSLEKVWQIYDEAPLIKDFDLLRVSLSGEELKRFEENFSAIMKLKNASKVSISETIEIILAGANKLQASDIHIEPEKEGVRLRYRIDGVLQDIGSISADIYRLTLSRVKMLSRMKINIRDRAQDGHFGISLDGKLIDLRVNIIPGNHGESINMRILNNDDVLYDMTKLGIQGATYDKIKQETEKPHGMIINTGPTGAGKTTTLYSILRTVNSPDKKIITVEDPIEYQIQGIVQTEVSKGREYGFATALRAIVRQDPDVILIGEIRDDETAEIAVNAAMTGHLVLSTVHANTAPGAIPRLIELGAKPSALASALNVVIGQRLVRKLCEKCKESYLPAEETIDSLREILSIVSPKAKVEIPREITELWNPKGCPSCGMTGYHGRIGIYESFTISKDIEKAIVELGTEREIMRVAIEEGMVTMVQDGILKAIHGTTSLEEVWRATGQKNALREIYAELMPSILSRTSLLSKETFEAARAHLTTLEEFGRYAKTLGDSDVLRSIFAAALLLKAGDIHLEPADQEVLVRLRIDGILQTIAALPKVTYPQILGEIKLWSGLKSGQRSGVVDGRFSLTVKEPYEHIPAGTTDFRLSIILGGFGETAVMRILNNSLTTLSLESLSFRPENLVRIREGLKRANGIMINTGPTGSGKTTTLYSMLSKLNKPEVKIITVEDPIEYRLSGILQTQMNPEEGYTFSEALRALLRQNPDILMIGEIRDEDTAKIALQSAETGHLVLSTIHANSATGVIPRFLGMGASPDEIANTVICLISQRLVRKLCEHCRQEDVPTAEDLDLIDRVLKKVPENIGGQARTEKKIWKTTGCERCNGTGYTGQIVLSEVLSMDPDIEELITTGALMSQIEETAIKNGMLTLAGDGVLAVLEGRTTLDEIRRVTNE
ncbi:MAG: type II/IV secretion system protein [Candidatus Moranbacteria bacterium]|nr:type II/IV secretion system protein [Candidatus Moranbacteria bacterium]